jgi:spore maturation protein CgeB
VRVLVLSPRGEGQLGVSLAAGLRAAGHDATLAPGRGLTAGNRALVVARRRGAEAPLTAALTRRVIRQAERARADAVLVVKGRFLRAADVERLRDRLGVPVVNYFPDDPFHPDHHAPELIDALRAYDLVLIWADAPARRLEEAGARVAVVPFGYDPALFSPRPAGREPEHDVAFVGQWHPERQESLLRLAGLDVTVTGLGWAKALRGTPLESAVLPGRHFGREAAEVYWSARVGLNIVHPQNQAGNNMRTWELPATGTATVATRTPDHERIYGPEGAVLVDGPDDVRAAVEGLLADPARRERVAAAGRAAVAEATYERRAREIVARLEAL